MPASMRQFVKVKQGEKGGIFCVFGDAAVVNRQFQYKGKRGVYTRCRVLFR